MTKSLLYILSEALHFLFKAANLASKLVTSSCADSLLVFVDDSLAFSLSFPEVSFFSVEPLVDSFSLAGAESEASTARESGDWALFKTNKSEKMIQSIRIRVGVERQMQHSRELG